MVTDTVKLREFDLQPDHYACPSGPLAEGKEQYRVIGWEGGDRGALLLSPEERTAILAAFAAWREA